MPGRTARPAIAVRPHDALQSSPPSPGAAGWVDDAEYLWGVDLYNAGFFWEAHEVWEALWRDSARDPRQREFLQGLIQCAAACLKSTAGHPEACRRLAGRALARLQELAADGATPYMGLDVAAFITAFRDFAAAHPAEVEQRPWLALAWPA